MIKNFNVKDCWGDCIYVGNSSKNITIKGCKLDHGRRQGVSVTSADGVVIEDCTITNVRGTDPQAAIDLEPNQNETVDNVIIRNVYCENCYGGIETWKPQEARIGSVIIEGCSVMSSEKRWPIVIRYAESAKVDNCIVDAGDRTAILVTECGNTSVTSNKVTSTSKSPIAVTKCKKEVVRDNTIL